MNLTATVCQTRLPAFFTFYKQNNCEKSWAQKLATTFDRALPLNSSPFTTVFFNVLSFGHFLDFKSKSFKEVSNAWGAVWTLTIWEDFKKPSATWLERLWRLHMEFVSRIRDNGLDKHLVNSRGSSFRGTSRNT